MMTQKYSCELVFFFLSDPDLFKQGTFSPPHPQTKGFYDTEIHQQLMLRNRLP